ncbi:MAG: bifunctional diaminohydroxyphosphoribosylaminopyrimidine deaminase/5-amino-6-(5-phosphoribosylamino)uracil reductase RibD, partial [Candidatus Zixiibacteriota bacterium]
CGEGLTRPNPPVGAVVVRDGKVVGSGFHPAAGEPHAEIFALRQAGDLARGADLYVTLEPCNHHGRTGPCCEAVIAAGIARVFVGVADPNPIVAGSGLDRLKSASIQVETGLMEEECRWLIAPFAKHVRSGLPHVTLKAAMTLDGNIDTSTGESRWITGSASRERVHRLRNQCDAVMVGIGTVLADNPRLTTRLPVSGGRNALRIIVDSRLLTPEDAEVTRGTGDAPTLIATTMQASEEKSQRLRQLGVEVLRIEGSSDVVDLKVLMRILGQRGLQRILLEGGGILNSAALRAGIVDRVMFFLAPLVLGGRGTGVFFGTGVDFLGDAIRLSPIHLARIGDDIVIEGEVIRSCSQD